MEMRPAGQVVTSCHVKSQGANTGEAHSGLAYIRIALIKLLTARPKPETVQEMLPETQRHAIHVTCLDNRSICKRGLEIL